MGWKEAKEAAEFAAKKRAEAEKELQALAQSLKPFRESVESLIDYLALVHDLAGVVVNQFGQGARDPQRFDPTGPDYFLRLLRAVVTDLHHERLAAYQQAMDALLKSSLMDGVALEKKSVLQRQSRQVWFKDHRYEPHVADRFSLHYDRRVSQALADVWGFKMPEAKAASFDDEDDHDEDAGWPEDNT